MSAVRSSLNPPCLPQKQPTTARRVWIALLVGLWILAGCAAPTATPGNATAPPVPTDTAPTATQRVLPTIGGVEAGEPTVGITPTTAPSTPVPAKAGTPAASATVQATAKPPVPQATSIPAKNATAFPDPASYTWQTVTDGLVRPLAVTGDRQGRLLVIEQPGRIRVVDASGLRAAPYLDISDQVGSKGNEQGLLGLALHPAYTQNGLLYINYTDLNGNTVIARFKADPAKANADPASQKILLRVKQPYPNHNGGSMVFGPDGYLYMGLGDGGSAGDPQGNGQNLGSLLGKLLRIDVNSGDPYAIPDSNPFKDGKAKAEIWAYGLRNPWRFSFDRATGDLYIGDVGQDTWEEIDYLPAGSAGGTNFGWNFREGANPYKGTPSDSPTLTDPIFQYKHPSGCSVTGGYVYRGSALPEFTGIYLFGDYCNGKIWGLLRGADGSWQNQQLFKSGAYLSSFGEDDNGELYLTDNTNGVVLKLVKKS